MFSNSHNYNFNRVILVVFCATKINRIFNFYGFLCFFVELFFCFVLMNPKEGLRMVLIERKYILFLGSSLCFYNIDILHNLLNLLNRSFPLLFSNKGKPIPTIVYIIGKKILSEKTGIGCFDNK